MSDWSEKMASKLKKKSERQNTSDAKFVELQRIKREIGPKLMAAVKSDLASEVKALNVEMGQEIVTLEITPASEISIRANLESGVQFLRAEFEAESGHLTWRRRDGSKETFEVYASPEAKASFYSGMVPYSSGSIARQMLETLLEA